MLKASRSGARWWALIFLMGIGFAVTLVTAGSPQVNLPPFSHVAPPPTQIRRASRCRRCASLSAGCYGRP